MTSPIKSTLCFAFFAPVVLALVFCAGCFQSSDKTKKSRNTSSKSDVARSEPSSLERRQSESCGDCSITGKSVETSKSTPTTSLMRSLQTESDRNDMLADAPVLTLPESIDWSIPEEKSADIAEKITAGNAVANVSDAAVENTVENTVHNMTEQTGDGEKVNPFAVIEETTAQTTQTQTTDDQATGEQPVGGETSNDTTAATPTDDTIGTTGSDAIDENVWEQGQEETHESLEHLRIKQAEYDDAKDMFRPAPDRRRGTADNILRDDAPDNGPNVIRNELNGQNADEVWQAAKDADDHAGEAGQSVDAVINEQTSDDSPWQAVPEDEKESPESKAENESDVEIPTFNPGASALPNVQNDDGDLFGLEADAAAEEFGQTFGGQTTTTTPTKPATADDSNAGPNDGLDDGIWGGNNDFGSLDDFSTPDSTSETGTPGTTTETQRPTTPAPVRPDTSAVSPNRGDEMASVESLSAVEEYLINEAKLSPVKLMESVELLYKLDKPQLVKRLLRQLIDMELTKEDCLQIHKRVSPEIMLRLSVDQEYQPYGGHAVRKIVEGSKGYFESRLEIEKALQTLLSNATDRQKEDATRIILNGRETSIEFLLERLKASDDSKELSEVNGLLLASGDEARRALQESLMVQKLGMRSARLLARMGRSSDSRFLLPMMFDSRLTEQERGEVGEMIQKLSRKVPTQQESASIMYALGTNYFRAKVPFLTDANNNAPIWMFREGSELPKFVTVTEEDASRYFAEKYSRYATCLDPTVAAYRQLWLVTFFDLKGAELGSDNSIQINAELLQKLKTGLSIADVESALRLAMQQDHPIAARVAAELLGKFDDVEEVLYKRGSQSALVKAAGFSDRRVRFAALKSIMKLNPDRPYPGSSVVAQSLVFFTRATGQKRAIVVCPWAGDATTIANLLRPLGYTPETATMGRDAMQLAVSSADTEVMLLDVRTPNSDVAFLVQDMRADNRTHDVPIAVMASGWRVSRAERAALAENKPLDDNPIDSPSNNSQNEVQLAAGITAEEQPVDETAVPNSLAWAPQFPAPQQKGENSFVIGEDEYVISGDQMARAEKAAYGSKMALAMPKPYDEASAKFVIESLMRETGVEHVPPQVRLDEAKHSIRWVTELYQKPNLYRFENIEEIAYATIWEPLLTAESLKLVELIPTPMAQQMMTQIISTPNCPLEIRQAALQSFQKNAQAYGVLIRGRRILDLYDAYNASGGEPVASQEVRSALLDVVEAYANYMQNVSYRK